MGRAALLAVAQKPPECAFAQCSQVFPHSQKTPLLWLRACSKKTGFSHAVKLRKVPAIRSLYRQAGRWTSVASMLPRRFSSGPSKGYDFKQCLAMLPIGAIAAARLRMLWGAGPITRLQCLNRLERATDAAVKWIPKRMQALREGSRFFGDAADICASGRRATPDH